MPRVVVLGRGGAGTSTLATALGAATGLPVVELDRHFWGPALEATPLDRWAVVQGRLAGADRWSSSKCAGVLVALPERRSGDSSRGRVTAPAGSPCRAR